ncbi:MAG: hypothetical protein D6785_11440 [Planctomycetota bacterium]|nr:MAG: hypothetical protein D6785_11440 [Planctomycetota bacterium]
MIILAKVGITLLTALGTIILLVLNYRANRISEKSVEELVRSREEEFRPYVFFDIIFKESEMHFQVKNHGKAAAHNIHITLDQEWKVWNSLSSEKDYTFSDMGISEEITMLAPDEEYCEWVDTSFRFFQNNESRKMTGKVQYEDEQGNPYVFPIDMDLVPYEERVLLIQRDFDDLVKAVTELRREMERKLK